LYKISVRGFATDFTELMNCFAWHLLDLGHEFPCFLTFHDKDFIGRKNCYPFHLATNLYYYFEVDMKMKTTLPNLNGLAFKVCDCTIDTMEASKVTIAQLLVIEDLFGEIMRLAESGQNL